MAKISGLIEIEKLRFKIRLQKSPILIAWLKIYSIAMITEAIFQYLPWNLRKYSTGPELVFRKHADVTSLAT